MNFSGIPKEEQRRGKRIFPLLRYKNRVHSSCCEKTIFPKRKRIFHFQSYVLLKFFNFPISPGSSSLKNLIEIRILARLVDTSGFVGYFSIAKGLI